MDIKRLLNISTFTPTKTVSKAERVVQNESAQDRDANGQEMYQKQQSPEHQAMSDEEFENSLEALQALPSIKEHNWKVTALVEDEKRFAIVKDGLGNLIRKIPEAELWSLRQNLDQPRGHLLKKTA